MGSLSMQDAAFVESKRLGHSWLGPEEGLLAILRGDPDDVARRALEAAELDADRFERCYVDMVERSDPPAKRYPDERRFISPNPAWYIVIGRAEGFAVFAGHRDVRPVDLLLALLWDTREWLPVEGLGVTREAVVDNLARAGVTLPATPLPDFERLPSMPIRVDFPKSALRGVVDLLVERHPPGSALRWGVNEDGVERAWAFAQEGIDLQGIVDEVLAEQGGTTPDLERN